MTRQPITRCCCDVHPRYTPGCRPCMDRAARWQKQYAYERAQGLNRRVPAAPYAEMIGRLNANGWPGHILAEKIGWATRFFSRCQLSRRTWVGVEFAQRIEKVVRELSDYPGPSGITRARAIAAGYVPYYLDGTLDDDPVIDTVAIDRALKGEPATLSPEEKAEALRVGVARGMLPFTVAKLLRMNGEMVNRYLAGGQPKQRGPKKAA